AARRGGPRAAAAPWCPARSPPPALHPPRSDEDRGRDGLRGGAGVLLGRAEPAGRAGGTYRRAVAAPLPGGWGRGGSSGLVESAAHWLWGAGMRLAPCRAPAAG